MLPFLFHVKRLSFLHFSRWSFWIRVALRQRVSTSAVIFLLLRRKIFCGCTYSNLSASILLPPQMLDLSPPVCLVRLEEILMAHGKEWLARKRSRQRRGLRSGWDLCYWRWCIYLRTRVNRNSCQNGELKHRLQAMLWYLKLRTRLLEDKVAWVDYGESHKQSST